VYPGGSAATPVVTTVSEAVESDTKQIVYSGFVQPYPPQYTVTIKLALAANPTGEGSDGNYALVADRVQLELLSLSTNDTSGNNGSPWATTHSSMGFGFFEWNSASIPINATGIINNSSETSFDKVSTQFADSLGGSTSTAVVNAVVATSESVLFLGGSFTANVSSNIISFANGALVSIAGAGLNGTVQALAYANGTLYVGGSFGGVQAGSGPAALRHIASYNVNAGSWAALGGGVNGPVSSLSIAGGQLIVVGNFSETYTSDNSFGTQSGGVATWDVGLGEWVSGGALVLGSASFAFQDAGTEYIAGNIGAISGNSAPGWSILTSDKSGNPSLTGAAAPLSDALEISPSSVLPGATRRDESNDPTSWLVPRFFRTSVFPRYLADTNTSANALPPYPSAPAPAVLAIAFWTNETTSQEAIVLGGNFSFMASGTSESSSGVALYDTSTKSLAPLKGNQVNGTVYSLFVKDHSLYVGGAFTVGPSSGFAVYDVDSLAWTTNIGALSGTPSWTIA
jgi:hypothetical protein